MSNYRCTPMPSNIWDLVRIWNHSLTSIATYCFDNFLFYWMRRRLPSTESCISYLLELIVNMDNSYVFPLTQRTLAYRTCLRTRGWHTNITRLKVLIYSLRYETEIIPFIISKFKNKLDLPLSFLHRGKPFLEMFLLN